MHDPLNILVVDDDDGDRKRIKRVLRQPGLPIKSTEAASIHEALEACGKCAFDCAIVDYRLTGQDGLAGITALRERFPDMAIIMATGQGDEMVAAEAIKRGASDYIPKSLITANSLRRSIVNAIEKATLLRTVSQQREELEVFNRVLVHDLKAPIHSALGFAVLVEMNIHEGKPDEVVSYCRKVVGAVERMGVLIETLDRYTSAEQQVLFERLEMRDVMADTLSNLEHLVQERGARVTYSEFPAVYGTPQLTQLLQNLISNSIKYCEAKIPVIHVSAKLQERNVWLFSVKDNGIGIPEKHYQQIFEPFHRLERDAKYKGTGLGLATCKKIVERHGGSMSCESREGGGTTFSFTLHGAWPELRD